jgi:hypothetical protein
VRKKASMTKNNNNKTCAQKAGFLKILTVELTEIMFEHYPYIKLEESGDRFFPFRKHFLRGDKPVFFVSYW